MDIKTTPILVKAGPEDGLKEGEFVAYPSTFTKTPDSYGDIVAPGAFLDTIAEWKASGGILPGLYGHRMDDPDYFVAGATDMGEDDHGWWVKGQFDLDSPKGPQVYRLVKGRRLRQLSFAYDTLDEGQVSLEDGTKANELRRLKVYEFSFVPIGANQDTEVVAVKALAERIATDVKAGRAISAKNETALREAAAKITGAAKDIEDVLSVLGEVNDDQEKASGTRRAKDEEPAGAKSEEPRAESSVNRLSAQATIYALTAAQEGVQS